MRSLLPLLCYLSSAYALKVARVELDAAPATPDLRRPHLVAQAPAEPAPTTAGSIVAGTYTGVMQFTFAATCATIIFAPVGLPLAIGISHALVGFVITQMLVAKTTGVKGGVALAVPSFEVLPFLAKFAVIVAGANAPAGEALATVLAGSILATALGAALLAAASELPVDAIDRLLPPPLQAGLFASIGWSLYCLSFDTLGLSATPSSLCTRQVYIYT